jgi:tripartite motif-containing protein 71
LSSAPRTTAGPAPCAKRSSTRNPSPIALGAAGDLYVIDDGTGIQKRDAQGKWSVIDATGQVRSPSALAVDGAGNIYVASSNDGDIHRRNAQGHWSVIAPSGPNLGQVTNPEGLAVDGADNLYVADTGNNRVLKYMSAP